MALSEERISFTSFSHLQNVQDKNKKRTELQVRFMEKMHNKGVCVYFPFSNVIVLLFEQPRREEADWLSVSMQAGKPLCVG